MGPLQPPGPSLAQESQESWVPVAQTCNPSYSGGRDQEDHGSKPAQAHSSARPYLKKPFKKIGQVECLKVKTLSSSPSTTKEKKKKKKKKPRTELTQRPQVLALHPATNPSFVSSPWQP
jgi:hypothetical protein